jgi:hypothetical protein
MCKIFTSLRPKINFNSNIVCIKIHINTNAGKSNLSCYGAREQYNQRICNGSDRFAQNRCGVIHHLTLPAHNRIGAYSVYIPDVKWTVRSAVYNLKL